MDEYLNTAWSMQIARGAVIATVAFLLAPHAAAFFEEPRTADIIRVIALLPFIIGFQNPGIVYLQKNLEFHRRFVHALSGPVANVSTSIVLAVLYQNVWALVVGSVVGTFVTLLASYYVHEYRPSPEFDHGMAQELYGYGKWITASAMVLFLTTQGDDAFVGWFLTASALGFYQLAYRLSSAPAKEVGSVLGSVVFPAYSQLQTDSTKLRRTCYKSVKLVTVISFPMVVGIIVVSPVFIRAILGEKWLPMILSVQILAFWGGLRTINTTVGPVFKAIGRPDYNTKLQTLQLVVIALVIYPATARWGIAGTGLAIVSSGLVSTPILVTLALRELEGEPVEFLRILLYPTLGSLFMGGGVLYLRDTLHLGALFELVVLILAGVVLYTVIMIGFDKRLNYGIKSLLVQIIDALG